MSQHVSPDQVLRRPPHRRHEAPPPTSAANEPAVAPGVRAELPTLSCVVPCHNEAANLAHLLPLLAEQLPVCSRSFEVILVDDGSTDSTPLLLAGWARRGGFRVLQLSRNFGKEAALTAGLAAALGEVVVMMDADLQHPAELIGKFVEEWQCGADVVYATRANRDDEGAFKRIGTRCFYALVNAADRFVVPSGAGDFRLLDRSVVDALLSLPERNRFMKGLYAWVGFKAVGVPYVPNPRFSGKSNFSVLRLVRMSLDGLTAFTTWPLRAVSLMGFVLAALAFLYGGYLTFAYFVEGNAVSGWTTIAVSLLAFAGIQLISVGILGEYIGRIFEEVKARPLFVVQRELGRGLKKGPSQ